MFLVFVGVSAYEKGWNGIFDEDLESFESVKQKIAICPHALISHLGIIKTRRSTDIIQKTKQLRLNSLPYVGPYRPRFWAFEK